MSPLSDVENHKFVSWLLTEQIFAEDVVFYVVPQSVMIR